MWKITTRGFTLEEVLIMAAMNLLISADTAAKRENRTVAEIKRRPSMQLKYSIKRSALVVGVLALVSITSVAQENRSEISIQGTGLFTKDTAGNGVFEGANDTGGFLLGYRYNVNRWLAAEANYGYDRNTQFYFGGTPARVQSDIHQITGSVVVKLPSFARLQPNALAGAGALAFDPTGNFGGTFAGATLETKAAFVYGGGAQYAFTRHFSLRAGLGNLRPAVCVQACKVGARCFVDQTAILVNSATARCIVAISSI